MGQDGFAWPVANASKWVGIAGTCLGLGSLGAVIWLPPARFMGWYPLMILFASVLLYGLGAGTSDRLDASRLPEKSAVPGNSFLVGGLGIAGGIASLVVFGGESAVVGVFLVFTGCLAIVIGIAWDFFE